MNRNMWCYAVWNTNNLTRLHYAVAFTAEANGKGAIDRAALAGANEATIDAVDEAIDDLERLQFVRRLDSNRLWLNFGNTHVNRRALAAAHWNRVSLYRHDDLERRIALFTKGFVSNDTPRAQA